MTEFQKTPLKHVVFLQICVFVMFYVTQITKKRLKSLLQSPHSKFMGSLYG